MIAPATVTGMGTIETPWLQRIAQQQLSKHPTDLSKQQSYIFFQAASTPQQCRLFCVASLSGNVFEHIQGYLWSCTAPHLSFAKALACVLVLG